MKKAQAFGRIHTGCQLAIGLAGGLLCAGAALAVEYPIGTPQQRHGMEIAAVYLQPIEMEPEGHMRAAAESDVHMEADIRALDSNPNGFAEGEFVPYLLVKFEVTKLDSKETISGDFMSMVSSVPTFSRRGCITS